MATAAKIVAVYCYLLVMNSTVAVGAKHNAIKQRV